MNNKDIAQTILKFIKDRQTCFNFSLVSKQFYKAFKILEEVKKLELPKERCRYIYMRGIKKTDRCELDVYEKGYCKGCLNKKGVKISLGQI